MLHTLLLPVALLGATGRHAADEPDPPVVVVRWWQRLLPAQHDDPVAGFATGAGDLVVRLVGPLDDEAAPQVDACLGRVRRLRPHEVVVLRMDGCHFVNARGFRVLLRLQEEVHRRGARLLVVDPPHSLRTLCGLAPGRLVLVPADAVGSPDGPS